MNKQILFSFVVLIAVSCMPVKAVESNGNSTLTGRSTNTLVKALLKIAAGSFCLWNVYRVNCARDSSSQVSYDKKDSMTVFIIDTTIGACFVGVGAWLIQSGIKDLNEEELEIKPKEAVKAA